MPAIARFYEKHASQWMDHGVRQPGAAAAACYLLLELPIGVAAGTAPTLTDRLSRPGHITSTIIATIIQAASQIAISRMACPPRVMHRMSIAQCRGDRETAQRA